MRLVQGSRIDGGNANTVVGFGAWAKDGAGSQTTCIGAEAATDGSRNVCVGRLATCSSANDTVVLGANSNSYYGSSNITGANLLNVTPNSLLIVQVQILGVIVIIYVI